MGKVILLLLLAAVAALLWQVRKERARRVLAEIDAGRRCTACGTDAMERIGNRARCTRCGQSVNLSWLEQARVTGQDGRRDERE